MLFPFSCHASDITALIDSRLALMKEVAAYKWHTNQPIEDVEREKTVLSAASLSGLTYNITMRSSSAFFQAQIEAAKDIQSCWMARWRAGEPPPVPQNLVTVLRPRLLNLGEAITRALATPRAEPSQVNTVECLSEPHRLAIENTMAGIRTYPDRLSQVTGSGILRVGTTGDYAPFSYGDDGELLTGIDIDLANLLAKSLGAEVRFIKTSWPDLTEDFTAGLFDIAMSGVSITEARKQHGDFSEPYHVGGKTPIARCARIGEFASVSDINQPGVWVIVNPGGTNEAFVNTHLPRVNKVMHDDNRTIFDEIVAGGADLMITDKIEVQLQTALHPELCGSDSEPFTYQEKGYWLPREARLKASVDGWLMTIRQSGELEQVFNAHLAPRP